MCIYESTHSEKKMIANSIGLMFIYDKLSDLRLSEYKLPPKEKKCES